MGYRHVFLGHRLFHVVGNREIRQSYLNMRPYMISQHLDVSASAKFLEEQDQWTRSMIKNHPSDEDVYWRHVEYLMAQYDGLYAGYRDAALPEWVRRYLHFYWYFYDSGVAMNLLKGTRKPTAGFRGRVPVGV